MKSSKVKTVFVCADCGEEYSQWQGKCTACQQWNTIAKLHLAPATPASNTSGYVANVLPELQTLHQLEISESSRTATFAKEFDRVLGGGLVAGSTVLLAGNPGIGKSTLLLQTLAHLSTTHNCIYATGEESLNQIAMRAQRLNLHSARLQLLNETNIFSIIELATSSKADVVVVDSIQVMYSPEFPSSPGSVTQIREGATALTRFAKHSNTTIILVGHVTKDGSIAGPKTLEHSVDCSINFESSNDSRFRTLRASKNRFGAINELGVFAMTDTGLKEVSNPSAIFLNRSGQNHPGTITTVLWEGTRTLLLEIQALVDTTHGHTPRRVSIGVDSNKINMLIAILHRHVGILVADQDVFINIVGGVRITETGGDLALLLSIVSSLRNTPLPTSMCAFGEVGLTGEIRPVPSGQERLQEAIKHGFVTAIIPQGNMPKKVATNCTVHAVATLQQAIDAAFAT